jgi:hypothetical protein
MSKRTWGVPRAISFGPVLLCAASALAWQQLGYQDTPIIPGTPWHVHDGQRPQPRTVAAGERFSDAAPAPADAIVLFDGTHLERWQGNRGQEAGWTVKEGFFEVTRGQGNLRTKDRFPDFQLHLEFATPADSAGSSQGRGNSGVLINGMYEVQLLDSHNNPTYPDGQCGALYGQTPPLVNAARPAGQWQTYDIIFEAPHWDEQRQLTKRANVTVIHNGIVLHHKREYIGATDGIGGVPHKALAEYKQVHPPEVFLELQDHGDPVRFRNIWIRPLGQYDAP